MDCKEFREVLDLQVDRELSPEALMAARLHLDECSRCRRAEGELLKMRSALKLVVSKHEPPPELVRKVQQLSHSHSRFRRDSRLKKGWLWRERIAIPAPAFALLLFAFAAFAVVAARALWINRPKTPAVATREVIYNQTKTDLIDLSRFDHGGRASLYKESR